MLLFLESGVHPLTFLFSLRWVPDSAAREGDTGMRIVTRSLDVSLFGRLANSLISCIASEVSVGVGKGIGGGAKAG